ncbi:glutamate synthase-related protein [Celeribacter sp.]|uniref:glutamate synthase-related protein n=1 Tax=Celeribacter sp. TaxID=1890673 RepID=UPI003A9507A4
MHQSSTPFGLYDPSLEHSNCGVGFLTRKDSTQTHEVLTMGHEALCAVPHRGGMSSEGVGDGAGISVDLSLSLFEKLTGEKLEKGAFGVGNFFMPADGSQLPRAIALIENALKEAGMKIVLERDVPVNNDVLLPRAVAYQLPIRQWIFTAPEDVRGAALDARIHRALLAIEAVAYTDPLLDGLYPLSLSARTQVFKGRLNSWEIIPYFEDLSDPDHKIHTLYFHTRFSTNTDPHPSMAQPFRLMAHNGELNTDKKNRLSEAAVALARNTAIIRPKGQSDSCRLDQTLNARVYEEGLDLVTAVVAMMPPAWENDARMPDNVKAMFEYFSLYEEKNDGPAALCFGDGTIIGARLDRLGLRPLRSVETEDYLAVMSEAGQISFAPDTVLRRGRVKAGGMIYYNHADRKLYENDEALALLARQADYKALVQAAQVNIDDLPDPESDPKAASKVYDGDLCRHARYVAYTLNQESFKFLMDPMLQSGVEKVSAMGYGNAINALSDNEGGVAKYFSQRFAQVTNPPLDSIREADGMTLRVALGEKPYLGQSRSRQIVVNSPILKMADMLKIKAQEDTPWATFNILYTPVFGDGAANERALTEAIDAVAAEVAKFARDEGGIAILTDRHITSTLCPLPMTMAVSAINQKLIEEGLRLKVSLVVESGQISSSHHICCALGFGAAAVYPLGVRMRAEEVYGDQATDAFRKFHKAAAKAIMKTMGKVGLCTVESYSGGEFFEPNFLDTNDPVFRKYFPNMKTPVGGVRFNTVAQSVADWHERALTIKTFDDIPMLGLFKERSEGAGHSYGTTAVREFVNLTEEPLAFTRPDDDPAKDETDPMRLLTLRQMNDAFGIDEAGYIHTSFDKLTKEQIDSFDITPGYRAFSRAMADERARRPAALRDVLAFPADITYLSSAADIKREMMLFNRAGNNDFVIRGLEVWQIKPGEFGLRLTGPKAKEISRLDALAQSLVERFGADVHGHWVETGKLHVACKGKALDYLSRIRKAPEPLDLSEVQPASEITGRLASGAMSHGALVASAHEAVAHGTNMAGGMSNSGEGGEHISRYGTIRASRIKQFASGRFGVWAGYLADPNLEEIEIKIGQGAKPGEGGQLPAPKVTVEIAAARGGTPGVELISPPPHHDTYSIEDLGQLIHDAKAARVRVIVKLVSSEGIGTIAVGVAKAGAYVINVAGNTGGTGAASVTSLKYTGRAAEIGIAEVHQALCANGIRQKVMLRCSGAMQTGSDVVKAALMGGDSFEFGTTALMMLKCVMAKNCNVKCPAGLTTNPEVFDGDPRALAQYLVNIAHEVREILALLGFRSLDEARGRADLLHLLDHPSSVGQLNLRAMLTCVPEVRVENPVYLERDYMVDDLLLDQMQVRLVKGGEDQIVLKPNEALNNRNKSVGGQLAIDIERMLNHGDGPLPKAARTDERGRSFLDMRAVRVQTQGSAGQSFGAFCNDGLVMEHVGTCNDGVGKGQCGGEIIVHSPGGGSETENVLIGNFALFGATGGRCFINGQAGDRFAVRNSGATAVVEGVGEFCAEYMTHGAVLNLGDFSTGFGNGMSGGFAYQYDPEHRMPALMSRDSVLSGTLADGSAQAEIHREAVRQLLQWHIEATQSARAEKLLGAFDARLDDFAWVMPKALLQYQDADEIKAAKSRKDLVEELATALSNHQIAEVKKAWRQGVNVLKGAVPAYGETDTDEMFRLLGSYTVMDLARVQAEKRVGKNDPRALGKAQRNLILTEDFALMMALAKHARAAIADYSDDELASLVANKRLSDFKRALSMRNILSMDSPGTYAWILHQSAKNRRALGEIPSFDALFVQQSLPDVLARTAAE